MNGKVTWVEIVATGKVQRIDFGAKLWLGIVEIVDKTMEGEGLGGRRVRGGKTKEQGGRRQKRERRERIKTTLSVRPLCHCPFLAAIFRTDPTIELNCENEIDVPECVLVAGSGGHGARHRHSLPGPESEPECAQPRMEQL